MRSLLLSLISALFISLPVAFAETAGVGAPAPDFTLTDSSGKQVTLSSFRGKNVVLEWFNPECPFVKKFYSGGEMQKLQQQVTSGGDVWLTINSSAAGKQGHISQSDAADVVTKQGLKSTALLLDPAGTVGKQYGARTTPHMFVIDAKGTVAYGGAIDSVPSTDSEDITGATNYVQAAIVHLKDGKPIPTSATEPYGCSVKY
jgi:peroxiredoxin